MTPSTILAIAEKHSAYPDTAMTIRGKADILAFAEELLSVAGVKRTNPLSYEAPFTESEKQSGGDPIPLMQPRKSGYSFSQSKTPSIKAEPTMDERRDVMNKLAVLCKERIGTPSTKKIIKRWSLYESKLFDIPEEHIENAIRDFERVLSETESDEQVDGYCGLPVEALGMK